MKNYMMKVLFYGAGLCCISGADGMRRSNWLRQTEFIAYSVAELNKSENQAGFVLTLDDSSFSRDDSSIYLAFWNCGDDEDGRKETVYLHAHFDFRWSEAYAAGRPLNRDSWGRSVIETWVNNWTGD